MIVVRPESAVFPFDNHMPPPNQFACGYRNAQGNFQNWQSCREVMQLQFKLDHAGFWYSITETTLPKIIECMNWVENTLCVREPTNFYRHPQGLLTWIEPAPFWKRCEMSKNLFTLFLRIAYTYSTMPEGKKIYDAFKLYTYSKDTLPALDRYLHGFTRYIGPELVPAGPTSTYITMGWHSIFGLRDTAYAKTLLKA